MTEENFNPMAAAVAPTTPSPKPSDVLKDDLHVSPTMTKTKSVAGVNKDISAAALTRCAEHKVFRMAVTLFANASANMEHQQIKNFTDLILDGFVPYAAVNGDMGHCFVFMFRKAS